MDRNLLLIRFNSIAILGTFSVLVFACLSYIFEGNGQDWRFRSMVCFEGSQFLWYLQHNLYIFCTFLCESLENHRGLFYHFHLQPIPRKKYSNMRIEEWALEWSMTIWSNCIAFDSYVIIFTWSLFGVAEIAVNASSVQFRSITGRLCPLLTSYNLIWPYFDTVEIKLDDNGSE